MRIRWLISLGLLGLAACTPPAANGPVLTLTAAPTAAITAHPRKAALEAALDWSCPADVAGQTLRIANWPDYVAPDTISNFEALCGVTVDYQIYSSSEEMFNWLSEGRSFDVVVPTSSYVLRLVQLNMLYPLRPAQIAHRENINPKFMNFPFDPENRYTTPYAWGTTGVTYRVDALNGPLESWDQFFRYEGPVAWLDEYRMMMNLALAMTGFKPNSTDADEIKAAKDFLLDHINHVVKIGSYKTLRDSLVSGEIDMAIDYSGNAQLLASACDCETYQYTLLPHGSTIWIDNLVILEDAPNKHLAEVFISYILLPQVGADIANFTFYASANLKAVEGGLISSEILSNPIIYPPDDKIENLFFTLSVPETTQALYTQAWSEVVAAVEAKQDK